MTAYEPVLIPGPVADEVIAEARATATVELTFGGGPLDEAEAQLLDVGVHAGVLAAFRAVLDGRLP